MAFIKRRSEEYSTSEETGETRDGYLIISKMVIIPVEFQPLLRE